MTSQYTQIAQLSATNLLKNAFSSKTQKLSNNSDEAFSSVLDKAAKPYANKSENSTATHKGNKDYAQKTKDTNVKDTEKVKTSSDDSHIKNNKNDKKIKDKETSEKEHKNTRDSVSKDDTAFEVKDKEISVSEDAANEQNPIQEKSLLEQAAELAAKTVLDGTLAKESASLTVNYTEETDTADIVKQPEDTVTKPKEVAEKNVNTIVNEKLLANIEYTDTETLGVKAESLAELDIDIEAVKNIAEQSKNAQQQAIPKTAQEVPVDTLKNQPAAQAVEENIKTQSAKETPEVKVETNTESDSGKPADTTFKLKSAKENLAADTSRMTANLEQAVDEPVSTSTLKPVTPNDTEADKTPVIKVTNEAASQIRENAPTGIENKDTTTKIKAKAADEMTKLQDTDTVVTESKTAANDSNGANNSAGNTGANLSHGNAGELAAKLSVDQGAINNSQTGAETFVNKLDAQLSAKGTSTFTRTTTLNQTDILNQVNAKFEELQKTGNNKVSIILQPENLGRVSVEIMNSKDGIVAKMTTDSQQVKDLFDKNVEALKSNLSSQGVNVNNIKVECTQESANHGMEQEQFNQSFNQQQNGQNQAHHSGQDTHGAYGSEYLNTQSEPDAELSTTAEIKNTETIIKHNGKVDYTV